MTNDTLFNRLNDYSDTLNKSNNKLGVTYTYGDDCSYTGLISEASLSRAISHMKTNDFAIITAFRGDKTKSENIQRNKILLIALNSLKMGTHKLVGHWQEAPDGVDYQDATPDQLTDVTEISFLVPKPNNMSTKEFFLIIADLMTIDGETQDAVVIHTTTNLEMATGKMEPDTYYLMFKNKTNGELTFEKIGTNVSVGKIAQAYSSHSNKPDVSFVFEDGNTKQNFQFVGIEIPSTNNGRQMFQKVGLKW